MVMRDIDILGDKSEDYIILFGKERRIRRLKVKDYVKMQALLEEMSILTGKTDEEIKELENETFKVFRNFIEDFGRKEYDDMNLAQKMAVFNFIDELFLIDQGIPEEQVMEIKKLLETKRMNILAQSISNPENID